MVTVEVRGNSEKIFFFFLNRETNFKKGKQGTLSPKQSVDP